MHRVAILGGQPGEAWMHRRAWERLDGVEVVDDGAEILDLLAPLEGRTARALTALEQGQHVLLGPPFAESATDASGLATAAQRSPGILGACVPWSYYPPMTRLRELVTERTIGRVSAVRMRSLIAGQGGWDREMSPDFRGSRIPEPLPVPAVLCREAFEKLGIAAALLGPLREVICHDPGGEAPCARLVGWKHQARATYGVLELTVAPAMTVRSPYEPRHDILEITGSAGIAWLTRGSALLRNEPTLRVYQGENLLTYGNLEDDWQVGLDRCAAAFLARVADGVQPGLDEVVRAASWAEAAVRSGTNSRREAAD
jgi:predicted dehydrogenase